MPAHKKVFCLSGHELAVVGRINRGCARCRTIRQRSRLWHHAGILNKDGSPFTFADYDRYYQIQQGKCAGCGVHQSELRFSLCVDHDHNTGIFRHILCMNCNRALGLVRDNAIILRKLADLVDEKHDA